MNAAKEEVLRERWCVRILELSRIVSLVSSRSMHHIPDFHYRSMNARYSLEGSVYHDIVDESGTIKPDS